MLRLTATRPAPVSRACRASSGMLLPPAASATTRNRPGWSATTCNAWVPIEPVLPRITTSRTGPVCQVSGHALLSELPGGWAGGVPAVSPVNPGN